MAGFSLRRHPRSPALLCTLSRFSAPPQGVRIWQFAQDRLLLRSLLAVAFSTLSRFSAHARSGDSQSRTHVIAYGAGPYENRRPAAFEPFSVHCPAPSRSQGGLLSSDPHCRMRPSASPIPCREPVSCNATRSHLNVEISIIECIQRSYLLPLGDSACIQRTGPRASRIT